MVFSPRTLVNPFRLFRRRSSRIPALAGLVIFGAAAFASAQPAKSPAAGVAALPAEVVSRDAEGRVVIRATRITQPIRDRWPRR